MIDWTASLTERAARSDTGFDVADGWFDGVEEVVGIGVLGGGYIASYCCCWGNRL